MADRLEMCIISYLVIITSIFYSELFSSLYFPVHIGWVRFTFKPFLAVLLWLILRFRIRKDNLLIFALFSGFCVTAYIFSAHKNSAELNMLINALILLVMPAMKLDDITRASNISVFIMFIYTVFPRSLLTFLPYVYSFSTPLVMLLPFILCGVINGDKLSKLGLMAAVAGIFLTLSKDSWAVLLAVLPLFIITKSSIKFFLKVVLSMFVISLVFSPNLVWTIAKSRSCLFVRLDIWGNALKHISFIGQGLGYQVLSYGRMLGMHNTFLEALISGGIIGFTLYMAALILIFRRLLKDRSLLSIACLISLISWTIHGMFQVVMNEYIFWVIAGIALSMNDTGDRRRFALNK